MILACALTCAFVAGHALARADLSEVIFFAAATAILGVQV